MRVTAADEVRAIEADRLALLAGTGPLGLHSTYPGRWLSSLGVFLVWLPGPLPTGGKSRWTTVGTTPAANRAGRPQRCSRNSSYLLGTQADTIPQPIRDRALTTSALRCF